VEINLETPFTPSPRQELGLFSGLWGLGLGYSGFFSLISMCCLSED